ncbi:MAG: tRNA uridine-5-carboxymethylaminomethyl(34) synthesis GTPase MnmE [Verrucomicrobiota bacterium]
MDPHHHRDDGAKPEVRCRAPGGAGERVRVSEAIIPRETIAAISTPVGEGAIALIRLSGEGALAVADLIFRGKDSPSRLASHTQHLGEIVQDGIMLDQVMLSVHRSPQSYTGEDLIEITCHGGMLVTARVLEASLLAGARPARPGEFSERAYLNRKLDLTQAEAVIDLIRAQSDLALRSATEQLQGRLGERFRALRQETIAILAQVEASLDFPEEGIESDDQLTIRSRIETLSRRLREILATAETGRILREGLRVVIFGATNAGKSSLLNRLLGIDRAIVSETHGTTRDTIEERIDLRGVPLRLFDTAGLRAPENTVERAGIERTERSLELADLRLHLVDGNAARSAEFDPAADELLVINKRDLPPHGDWDGIDAVRISCRTGEGFAELEEEIFRHLGALNFNAESPLAINARHRARLSEAALACERALEEMGRGATAEMFAVDLRDALAALDELLGGRDEEAVRDAVFNQFCIGK